MEKKCLKSRECNDVLKKLQDLETYLNKTEKLRKIKNFNFNLFKCPEEESYNFHLVVVVQLMFLKLKTLPRQPFHIENQ